MFEMLVSRLVALHARNDEIGREVATAIDSRDNTRTAYVKQRMLQLADDADALARDASRAVEAGADPEPLYAIIAKSGAIASFARRGLAPVASE